MALALTMMVKYSEIDVNAAYSIFEQYGMKWAKYLVSICALKGMTTSLLVGSPGQARYTTPITRAHMIPLIFELVHSKTRTLVNATLLVTMIRAIVAFFSSLNVISSVLSFSTLFIFILITVALLIRQYYVKYVTPNNDLIKFLMCLFIIIGSSIGVLALWSSNERGWIRYTVAEWLWFLGILGMAFLSISKQRVPKVWEVLMVPWLSSYQL
ncbi:hypothetical protein REPUB_Repub05bG0085100 [Reevesia pubescens]